MEFFLFGIIGFTLGVGLFYWLQKRQLANAQKRLDRVQKALEQAEALNKQQATQLKKFREGQTQTQNIEHYYQGKLQELEQSYEARLQEQEQSPIPIPIPERETSEPIEHEHLQAEYNRLQGEYDRLQAEQQAQLQQITQELAASHQSQIAELEKTYQLQLDELRHGSQPHSQQQQINWNATPSPAPPDESWRKTEAHWGNIAENGPDSSLINPFASEELAKKLKSDGTPASEFDLAQLLESEDDAGFNGFGTAPDPKLRGLRQEQPAKSELDLFEILPNETETAAAAHLPEMSHNNSGDGSALTDLFSDLEGSSNELQEFLSMLELEGDSEAQQHGQKSGDRSKISFS